MAKKGFIVSYGGGHANIIRYLYPQLARVDGLEIEYLALTTAPVLLERHGIPHTTISEMAKKLPYYEEILRYGEQYGAALHNEESGIRREDTIAYYGIGIHDLIQVHGEEEGLALFREQGRFAFLPIPSMTKLLEYSKPDVCVVTTSPRMERAAGCAAAALGIRVVCINDLPTLDEPLGFPCDLCVMNEWGRDFAHRVMDIPLDRIRITGQPVFDGALSLPAAELEAVAERLCLSRYTAMVVFFTECGSDQSVELHALYEIAREREDLLFVVKLHPNQNLSDVPASENSNVVITKEDARYYLHLCDLAIATYSTTGLEAAWLNKPLIVVNFFRREYLLDYVGMGLALPAVDERSLKNGIEALLDHSSEPFLQLQASSRAFSRVHDACGKISKVIIGEEP